MTSANADDFRRGDRAIVLKPCLQGTSNAPRTPEARLEEAAGLAEAIGLDIVAREIVRIPHPSPSHLLGSGRVEQIGTTIKAEDITLAVVDHQLSPVQQRNLEKAWQCKVIDRTGLILEIFGERARTREGQLQVELAALTYQRSRLVRSWTHLERQRGGFGFLGGPGESQLEIDRRLINERIFRIKKDLKDVRRTRGLQRDARKRAEHPTVALVGYTNAGKSTLFNLLTKAEVLAKNMLFATLDPAMRGIRLPSGREVILSDTVGFIADLPTHLVEAFRATLEEVQTADLILHVRDVAHPDTRAQKEDVAHVLNELGITPGDPRLLEVQNKIDLIAPEERELLREDVKKTTRDSRKAVDATDIKPQARAGTVALSALTGEGVDDLLQAVDTALSEGEKLIDIAIPLENGAAISWLYAHGHILDRRDDARKAHLYLTLNEADYGRFRQRFLNGHEKT